MNILPLKCYLCIYLNRTHGIHSAKIPSAKDQDNVSLSLYVRKIVCDVYGELMFIGYGEGTKCPSFEQVKYYMPKQTNTE